MSVGYGFDDLGSIAQVIHDKEQLNLNENHKPGEIATESGQYPIIGPRGGKTDAGERTVTEGEPFPPTPKAGQRYGKPDRTKGGTRRRGK